MFPHNHSFSSPCNVNDAVDPSAHSHLSAGSAWDCSSMTSQGDVPTHSQDCVHHDYAMSWSGLNPAPDHGPEYSSAWNNSPASWSHAFNAGYDMVSTWGGRTPNIVEAFIQGTLFYQCARPPYPINGPSAHTPAGPSHGCVTCSYNMCFAARPGPWAPSSVSLGHPCSSGVNMPGAPQQPAPSVLRVPNLDLAC